MSLHVSQSQFCVPHIFTLQSWYLADDLPRIWENRSKTHQVQPIALGEAKQSVKMWRVCDDTSPAEVALVPSVSESWCESCCNLLDGCNQIHPLPISFRVASHVHTSVQVQPYAPGISGAVWRAQVTEWPRWTWIMKPQVCHTNTQSLVLLTPSSCWNWSAAHLIFHSDCCWQKTQGASSRYQSDNPLSGEGRFVWGWRARDRGINVEHRYPEISGKCL